MYYPKTMQPVDPKLAVRGATDMIRAYPSLLVWRVLADLVIQFGRVMLALVVVAIVVVAVVTSLRQGHSLGHALGIFRDPIFLLGLGGTGLAVLLLGFALDTLVWSGIWSSAGRILRGEHRLAFWGDAADSFHRAVWLRLVAMAHDAAILSLFGSLAICTSVLTQWAEMGLWASAVTWGMAMMFYVCAAVLIRLTASVTAAGMFVDQRTWADAWLEAAKTVVRQPIVFYRVFVLSAAMLLPPLLFYYFVLFVFNVTLGTPVAFAGELFRLFGEFVMLVGFALFFVVTQLGFFNAYTMARGQGVFERPGARSIDMARQTPPSLTDLLPRETPNVVKVDELLNLIPAEPVSAEIKVEHPSDPPRPPDDEQSFDLDSVLKPASASGTDKKDAD